MRTILLAAGRGRRLEASGWTAPKCLLPVGGTTILDNRLDALAAHGAQDLVLVAGYRQEEIRRHVASRGLSPAYVENQDRPDHRALAGRAAQDVQAEDPFEEFGPGVPAGTGSVGQRRRRAAPARLLDQRLPARWKQRLGTPAAG